MNNLPSPSITHATPAVGPALWGVPHIVAGAGDRASERFVEFFTAHIRNRNTRAAYARAVSRFFSWCDSFGLSLETIRPVHVAAYIEQHPGSKPSVKQALAAIRMLFDWLVVGQVVPANPAAAVRGPRFVAKQGKTPVLGAEEARTLLDGIDISTAAGLRDRALIGLMCYTFARVGAVVAMRVEDYYPSGKRWWVRLHEKGGKEHELPAHHALEGYLDAYIEATGIAAEPKSFLFRSIPGGVKLSDRPLSRTDVLRMIKRRSREHRLPLTTCNHTFRATGITAYLRNGGSLENAQRIAAHESPRTTKLYDRTGDQISLEEIERIRF
jgi:site-specific recombinase XerD